MHIYNYVCTWDVDIFVDINECSENTHTCSQVCVNDLGTYHCKCSSGYRRLVRTPTDVTCTGKHYNIIVTNE